MPSVWVHRCGIHDDADQRKDPTLGDNMFRKISLSIASLTAAIVFSTAAFAQVKELKPGFNLFSVQQDVDLGREAAAEVARQQPIVNNAELNRYLTGLVQRLARSPHAATDFPFSVKA